AEDIVQDSYIKIFRSIGKYRPGTNGLAWIIQITKNTALNYGEKQGRVVIVDYEPKDKGHEDKIANADYLDYVLKRLTAKERQIVTLHLYGEYTLREAADLVGITVTAAEWRYQSALKKLKATLIKDGVYHE
ncbi:MAG: RNA polymerase sigma factor, partial [Eubacteriales bacterium]|nr:RNA polymerase sigma factor [Eubacteriales bacterium]